MHYATCFFHPLDPWTCYVFWSPWFPSWFFGCFLMLASTPPLHPKPELSIKACLDLATELSEPQQTTSPPKLLLITIRAQNSAMDQRLYCQALLCKLCFWSLFHLTMNVNVYKDTWCTHSLSPSCSLQRQPMLSDSHLVSEPCSPCTKRTDYFLFSCINSNILCC